MARIAISQLDDADTLSDGDYLPISQPDAVNQATGKKGDTRKVMMHVVVNKARDTMAPLNSPNFTGMPTAPTPAVDTDSDQLATMAAILNNVSNSLSDTSTTKALSAAQGAAIKDKIGDLDTSAGSLSTVVAGIDERVVGIEKKIPTQASNINQLADKDFVNSSITNMAARYITSTLNGDTAWPDAAALAAGPWYNHGSTTTPSVNDYAVVIGEKTCRYVFDGAQWVLQYIVNDAPFTAAQLKAINSGATADIINAVAGNYTELNGKINDLDGKTAVNTGTLAAPVSDTGNETMGEKKVWPLFQSLVNKMAGRVPANRTIAGLSLGSNITDADLKTALKIQTITFVGSLPSTPDSSTLYLVEE